jgi:hypothetical protein
VRILAANSSGEATASSCTRARDNSLGMASDP